MLLKRVLTQPPFKLFWTITVFLISIYALSYGAKSEECQLPKRQIQRDIVPTGYKSCNIQNQLKNSRKIYDLALEQYKNNVEDLKTKPINGLIDILANTYALVNDYIIKDQAQKSSDKDKYLITLRESWARLYDIKDKLTSSIFQGVYLNLAYIIDQYKNEEEISLIRLMSQNPLAYPDWMDQTFIELQKFKEKMEIKFKEDGNLKKQYNDYIEHMEKHIRESIHESGFKDFGVSSIDQSFRVMIKEFNEGKKPGTFMAFPLDEGTETRDVIFIPCGNPIPGSARNISPIHFVKQFCDEKYPAYIALFDILSQPKSKNSSIKEQRNTPKDPHWSTSNGTLRMLGHDLSHIREQLSKLISPHARKYIQYVYRIQEKLREENNLNDATILINGLFMIIHERPDVAGLPPLVQPLTGEAVIHFFENISEKFTQQIMAYNDRYGLASYGSDAYKRENRDWEFILKDKYMDSDGTFKPVHDEKGAFLPIEYNHGRKKMTRPFKDDPLRNQKMSQALQDGYARFWSYFMSIIKKSTPMA